MGLTISDAKQRIADILDDPNKRRFSDAAIARQLLVSLTAVATDMAKTRKGAAMLTLQTPSLTTTSDGVLDLAAYNPMRVSAVWWLSGSGSSGALPFGQVRPIPTATPSVPYAQQQTLTVFYIPKPSLGADGDPLTEAFGVPDGIPDFTTVEEYVCWLAALQLGGLSPRRQEALSPAFRVLQEQYDDDFGGVEAIPDTYIGMPITPYIDMYAYKLRRNEILLQQTLLTLGGT